MNSKEKIINSMKKKEELPLNWGNFSFKKTFIGNSWSKFFWWILIMFLVFSYQHDTQACREMIENIDEICIERYGQMVFDGGVNARENPWIGDQREFPNYLQADSQEDAVKIP